MMCRMHGLIFVSIMFTAVFCESPRLSAVVADLFSQIIIIYDVVPEKILHGLFLSRVCFAW